MRTLRTWAWRCLLTAWLCLALATSLYAAGPLASWNQGAAKEAILKFVAQVTQAGAPGFVRPEERIAVFDNDGTLWAEKPLFFEGYFTIDRLRAVAPAHPDWQEKQPYKAFLEEGPKALRAFGEEGVIKLILPTHACLTTDEFQRAARDWIATAKHPRFDRPFTDLVYQPMLEVLALLRENGFKVYIVSGGETEFMRAWTERVYGVPPEQVVGTSIHLEFQIKEDGQPVLMRLPKFDVVTLGAAKAVGIQKAIGRRPIAAFGNSDGDIQMLQWTAAGAGPRLMLLVNHTDAEREWDYQEGAEEALRQAQRGGWTVVDMKNDWKKVFSFD